MTEYFDVLETRSPEAREQALMLALPAQVAFAKSDSDYYRSVLRDVNPAEINSRSALSALPVTRKSQLIELQRRNPPFGGLAAASTSSLARIFLSPGPIADPEGHGKDWFRFARALFAAGFRKGDLLHNSFAYHFTPAGRMFESAAHALGCVVFPAGTNALATYQGVRVADPAPT